MLGNKKLEKFNKLIFSIALFSIILRKYIIYFLNREIPIGGTLSYLLYIPIVLLGIQFLINKNRYKRGISFLLISLIVFLMTKDGSILVLMLMALSIEDINDKYIVKSYLNIHIIFMIVFMIFMQIMPDLAQTSEVHYRTVDGIRTARGTFGAGNPNFIFLILLPVYTAYIYLRFEKYKLLDRLIILSSLYIVYVNTYSRTGLLAIVAGLIFVEIIRFIKLKGNNLLTVLVSSSASILAIISVAVALLLNNSILANKLLSSRPIHWNVYLQQEGRVFNFFGNNYPSYIRKLHPVDNSYIYILSILGMVTLILLLILLYKGLKKYIEMDNKKNIVIVLIFIIFSFGENVLIDVALNFSLILLIKHAISYDNEKVNTYEYIQSILKNIKNRRINKC